MKPYKGLPFSTKDQPLLQNPKQQTEIIQDEHFNHQKHFRFSEKPHKKPTFNNHSKQQQKITNHAEDERTHQQDEEA